MDRGRAIRWGIRSAGLLGCGAVWLAPVSTHLKLVLALVVAAVALFTFLAWWSQGHPGRRRVFFTIIVFAPLVAVSNEALLAYGDWLQARLTAPLRLSTYDGSQGMLMRSDTVGYRLIPSRSHPLWDGQVAIDANGFRSKHPISRHKDTGRIRIILAGGSSAFGWGVPDGQDLGSQLRMLLNRGGGSRYEVINAAVPYYGSFQEVNCYLHFLWAFEPDVLLVLDGRNDAIFAVSQGREWRSVLEGETGPSPFWEPPQEVSSPTVGSYLEHALMSSATYRRMYAWTQPPPPPPPLPESPTLLPKPGPVDRRFIAQYVRHHQVLAKLTGEQGVGCVFALQPTLPLGKPLTPAERQVAERWAEQNRLLTEVWPELQRAALGVQGPMAKSVDLTDIFAGCTERAYVDGCHYTAEGNRRIAERLVGVIQELAARVSAAPRPPSGS